MSDRDVITPGKFVPAPSLFERRALARRTMSPAVAVAATPPPDLGREEKKSGLGLSIPCFDMEEEPADCPTAAVPLVEALVASPERSLTTLGFLRASLGRRAYTFTINFSGSLTSSAAGAYLPFVAISPGISSYYEYASLSALFDEVQLASSTLHLVPQVGSNGQNLEVAAAAPVVSQQIVCGVERDNISTAPASFAAVVRLAGSRLVARTVGDTCGVCTMHYVPAKLPWARATTPAVLDPPAGCLGTFNLATDGPLSNSTTYHKFVLKTIVRMRNRI